MNSITECLSQIADITKTNLSVLKTINEAFTTKKNHLSVTVGNNTYAVPSFISLESKIDTLQQDLDNILNAPKTGECTTYFDGTTQKIGLSGYSTSPDHIDLAGITKTSAVSNDIFKDFMTPNPFIRLDISSIGNNIKHVNVRKIVIRNPDLLANIQTLIDTGSNPAAVGFADIEKKLYNFTEDTDYVSYDTIRRLPLRTDNATGTYEITSINDDYTDDDFVEHYELVLDTELVYYIKNGTIQRDIQVGDYLVTSNNKVQLKVEEVFPLTKTIKVEVMYGAYADLCDNLSANSDLYKLKYYRSIDFDKTKYIDVPLEEDEYVIVFIAAISDTTNTQSPWGDGLYMDTWNLTTDISDGKGGYYSFKEYYDSFVNNVADSLFAITSMMSDDSQISKLTSTEFDNLKNYTPVIDGTALDVIQINKHLNDSSSVKSIRSLYNQKTQYKNELTTVQQSIDNINETLANTAFDESSNVRAIYTAQLTELNARKTELNNSIYSICTEINEAANNSEVPIENAKYHIRGFADVTLASTLKAEVIKIAVEYRYKNKNNLTGNAATIGSYIYSDWNPMDSMYRHLVPSWSANTYHYTLEALNEDQNVPSFNQLDIPITQGETVDIRMKYIYNLGYPFAEFTSSWSEVYNMAFPEKYLSNVEILDIISENNDDIKTNQFSSILQKNGITDHVGDSVQDQTLTYFHQPEHIASGFYTSERRIIPLKDKLVDFGADIEELKSEVMGSLSDNLLVTASDNDNSVTLLPGVLSTFTVPAYVDNTNTITAPGAFNGTQVDLNVAVANVNITLYNNGSYNMKLHTLFPGDYNTNLNSATGKNSKYSCSDYAFTISQVYSPSNPVEGVWMSMSSVNTIQRLNQILYFRVKGENGEILCDNDPLFTYDWRSGDTFNTTGTGYSEYRSKNTKDNLFEQRITNGPTLNGSGDRFAYINPFPETSTLCIPNNSTYSIIKPGESVSIPLSYYYYLANPGIKITKSIAFDVRTSLFTDPRTYILNIEANHTGLKAYELKTKDVLSTLNNPVYRTSINKAAINALNKKTL